MDNYDVKRLALVLAIQAEIESMKADNVNREIIGCSPAYGEYHFLQKAEELRKVANIPNEQL